MDARKSQVIGDLAEGHRTSVRLVESPPPLWIPERMTHRGSRPPESPAPLVDHPVVVGTHARQADLAIVLRLLAECLPTEREPREARRLYVVDVHVLRRATGSVGTSYVVVGHRVVGSYVCADSTVPA